MNLTHNLAQIGCSWPSVGEWMIHVSDNGWLVSSLCWWYSKKVLLTFTIVKYFVFLFQYLHILSMGVFSPKIVVNLTPSSSGSSVTFLDGSLVFWLVNPSLIHAFKLLQKSLRIQLRHDRFSLGVCLKKIQGFLGSSKLTWILSEAFCGIYKRTCDCLYRKKCPHLIIKTPSVTFTAAAFFFFL